MTDTPRLWDRRADETPKSYAAFLAYVALGGRRSVREAAHQYHINTTSTGEISSVDVGIPFTQVPTTGCGGVSSSDHGYP